MKRYTSDQIRSHLLSHKEKEEKDLAEESLNFINEKVELKRKREFLPKTKPSVKTLINLLKVLT